MSAPDPASRARGALLGHAAGIGLGGAARVGPGELVLLEILGDELLQPSVDLHRLAHRWAEWAARDGEGLSPWTRAALAHLRTHDSPPVAGAVDAAVLGRCLPVALRTLGSPANLVSGSYHIARLTHPDESCAWAAVGINVALACLLAGRRDFIAEVIEALRENGAPDELLAAARRVPVLRREELRPAAVVGEGSVAGLELALWLAYHEPVLQRGLSWLTDAGGGAHAPAAGGLLGARDGEPAIPRGWLPDPDTADRLRQLATRLVPASRAGPVSPVR